MANKTQMVTITLEEYKELLLKDKIDGNEATRVYQRMIDFFKNNINYSDETYFSDYVGDNMRISESREFCKEVLLIIKFIDFETYMEIWNYVMTEHRKDEEQKMKMKQMSDAKELRQENDQQ